MQRKFKIIQGALLALALTVSNGLFGQFSWSASITSAGGNAGCGYLIKRISYTNSQGCGVSDSKITLRKTDGSASQVYYGGGADNFVDLTITSSGTYEVYIESAPGSDLCNGISISPGTSIAVPITINPIPFASFNINGNTATSPTAIGVFACNTMNLNYTGSGTLTDYRLTVQSATSSGTTTSTYNSNPSGTWTSGAVPATTNLNTGANATAFTAGGYFLVTLETRTASCASVARKALINVTTSVAAPTSSFKVNGQSTPGCGAPLATFNCPSFAITLSNFSTGATSYKLDLFTAPTACSAYTHVHSTGVVTTFPTDAKNLPGAGSNGTALQTATGFYAFILTAYNACGAQAESQAVYFHVESAPPISTIFNTLTATKAGFGFSGPGCTIPPIASTSTGFRYNSDGTTNCIALSGYQYAMQHTNVLAPNEVGRLSTSFDLSGLGGGTGTVVTIRTDKWNGSTWDNLNSNGNPEIYTNVPSVQLIGLLTDDPNNPYYEHFLTAPNGGIYKITITVSNVCSSSSNTQIIKLNTSVLKSMIATSVDEEITEQNDAAAICTVFPNPSESEVSFQVTTREKDVVSISLYDLKGNLIKQVVTQEITNEGVSLFNANINELTSGMYLYKIQLNNEVYNGKLSKN
jgi:hypothetical protein